MRGHGERHLLPDRPGGADRPRGEERDPDRRVRAAGLPRGQERRRGGAASRAPALPADRDDLARLRARRAAADAVDRRGRRRAPLDGHRASSAACCSPPSSRRSSSRCSSCSSPGARRRRTPTRCTPRPNEARVPRSSRFRLHDRRAGLQAPGDRACRQSFPPRRRRSRPCRSGRLVDALQRPDAQRAGRLGAQPTTPTCASPRRRCRRPRR